MADSFITQAEETAEETYTAEDLARYERILAAVEAERTRRAAKVRRFCPCTWGDWNCAGCKSERTRAAEDGTALEGEDQ